MSTHVSTHTNTALSDELMHLILNLSEREIATFRRLLYQAERLKQASPANEKTTRKRRFVDSDNGGPTWDLGFVDEFDRMACYE